MSRILIAAAMLCVWAASAAGEPPIYPVKKTDEPKFSLLDEIMKIPPLKHDLGGRWPMIMWEGVSFEPQPAEVYQALLARGLTQHIRLDAKMIETAKCLQAAGSPVIMMQGAGGPFGYDQGPDWQHRFDAGYEPWKPDSWWPSGRACWAIFEGWQINADRLRDTLRQFKAAGVTVDAVWMDWEGEPSSSGSEGAWQNARHCSRCRQTLPPAVLADYPLWPGYCKRLSLELHGCYLVAPVREIFPACSVTNWMAVISTPERPVLGWRDTVVPPCMPCMFTATNPVAYGNDVFFKVAWKQSYKLDREHVDQFYMHLLLREISANQANAARYAPQVKAVPWVARFCPDAADPTIPMISRGRYRESLRHIWLRGCDAMQIFQPARPGYMDIVIGEVQDAVAVYDEMLAYREFLDKGEVLNTDTPAVQGDGVVWSGLRLGDRAIVRTFKQGGGSAKITIEPFPGKKIKLRATAEGEMHLLAAKDGTKIEEIDQ